MNLRDIFLKNVMNNKLYARGIGVEIREMLNNAKLKKITVAHLAGRIGVDTHDIYAWREQGIPVSKLKRLDGVFKTIVGRSLNKTTMLLGLEKSRHSLRVPSLTENLGYLLGYAAGDGSLNTYKGGLRVEFDDISEDYLKNIASLTYKLFGLTAKGPKKDKRHNCYSIRFDAKIFALFLNSVFGIPIGKKKNRLHIPHIIKTNRRILRNFIGGFIDAEGSIYYSPRMGYRIVISQKDKIMLNEVNDALESFGIYATTLADDHLTITNKNNFLKLIRTFKLLHPDKTSRIVLALNGKKTTRKIRLSSIKKNILTNLETLNSSKELSIKLGRKRRTIYFHLRELEGMGMVVREQKKRSCAIIWRKATFLTPPLARCVFSHNV